MVGMMSVFFFSSRRRHTRCSRDWSSDVCSSDLQTLNHLRGHLRTAINSARRAEQYTGPNPVSDVRPRRVPKRKPSFLEAHEVPRVLGEISTAWRPLFATAVYTGLRKGELLGLRK